MARSNPKAADVSPGTPVVTLKGVCKDRQAKSACETVITRQDLDIFINLFAPEAGETARGRMAVQYARNIAFSALAEQQGLEKNPALAKEIELQLKLVRMRILAGALLQTVQGPAASIAESEIQKYYEGHRELYEQAQVRRIWVPISAPTESGRPLDRRAIKAEMEELRSRAVAGEDFNELQLEAFKHLHIQATPPPVTLTMQRSGVQGDEAKAFDLKPGEISAVLDLLASFVIMKLESKDEVPLGSVRMAIEATLRQDRTQSEVHNLGKNISAEFNLQYLEMPSQPDIFAATAIASPASARRTARPQP